MCVHVPAFGVCARERGACTSPPVFFCEWRSNGFFLRRARPNPESQAEAPRFPNAWRWKCAGKNGDGKRQRPRFWPFTPTPLTSRVFEGGGWGGGTDSIVMELFSASSIEHLSACAHSDSSKKKVKKEFPIFWLWLSLNAVGTRLDSAPFRSKRFLSLVLVALAAIGQENVTRKWITRRCARRWWWWWW